MALYLLIHLHFYSSHSFSYYFHLFFPLFFFFFLDFYFTSIFLCLPYSLLLPSLTSSHISYCHLIAYMKRVVSHFSETISPKPYSNSPLNLTLTSNKTNPDCETHLSLAILDYSISYVRNIVARVDVYDWELRQVYLLVTFGTGNSNGTKDIPVIFGRFYRNRGCCSG